MEADTAQISVRLKPLSSQVNKVTTAEKLKNASTVDRIQ